MDEQLAELWQQIIARPSGKMAFRFYLQPLMAMFFAVRDGIHDAREGRPAYFWALFTDSTHRRNLVQNGWHSIRKVFFLAVILDVIYELWVLRELRPIQSLLVAITLALIPYTFLRGPANRLARLVMRASKRRRSVA